MKKALAALGFGTFALGIAEFGMMGILSDVASGVGVSIVRGGHFITAYSAGVAVGAPALIFLRRWPLKRLMLLLAALITLGNLLAALSPGYLSLLCSRFISGLPHGAFFGAGAIVAERLAPPGQQAKAVAVMVGGMTIANVVGVPLGTFIANSLSWRFTFGGVALCGLTALIGIRGWLPYLAPLPDTGLKGQFRFLRNPGPWLIYTGVFFGQGAVYCWLSYVDPAMTLVAGFPLPAMSWIMVVIGFGMVAGNALAGALADRFKASKVTMWIAVLTMFVMAAVWYFAASKAISVALAFVAAACLFGIGGPLQYLIVRYAKGGEMLGGAGIQIAFNVSNAVSSAVGGAVIQSGLGYSAPALAGVPFALIAAIALSILSTKYTPANL